MTERLLQFIWQFQYFNAKELSTTLGEEVVVIHPGQWNHHQGPDFSNARLRIAGQIWAGNVELHILSSDWRRHAHQHDHNYAHVILHVVWRDDQPRDRGPATVELEGRIPLLLLQQYRDWMQGSRFIPCADYLTHAGELVWVSWLDRLLIERLERRAGQIGLMLAQNKHDWEETLWWLLARNFGLSVNGQAFEEMARSLPWRLLSRHRRQLHRLEAMLFGQAGLLGACREDAYCGRLQSEYDFCRTKYRLEPIHSPVHFLRMRPPAFPTVRLAQLAMLLHRSDNLFSQLIETDSVVALRQLLAVEASDYWHDHYTFHQASRRSEKRMGTAMLNNIVINTLAPVVFAYGRFHGLERHTLQAVNWLSRLAGEQNVVTRGFAQCGRRSWMAAESQALLELKTQYCDHRRCLDCAIGNAIVKRGSGTAR